MCITALAHPVENPGLSGVGATPMCPPAAAEHIATDGGLPAVSQVPAPRGLPGRWIGSQAVVAGWASLGQPGEERVVRGEFRVAV